MSNNRIIKELSHLLADVPDAELQADIAAYFPAGISQADLTILTGYLTRNKSSKVTAQNIPNWAAWTQADWEAWYTANISPAQINAITSLAQAKTILLLMSSVLDKMAKMEIALRDQAWPDLSI